MALVREIFFPGNLGEGHVFPSATVLRLWQPAAACQIQRVIVCIMEAGFSAFIICGDVKTLRWGAFLPDPSFSFRTQSAPSFYPFYSPYLLLLNPT